MFNVNIALIPRCICVAYDVARDYRRPNQLLLLRKIAVGKSICN